MDILFEYAVLGVIGLIVFLCIRKKIRKNREKNLEENNNGVERATNTESKETESKETESKETESKETEEKLAKKYSEWNKKYIRELDNKIVFAEKDYSEFLADIEGELIQDTKEMRDFSAWGKFSEQEKIEIIDRFVAKQWNINYEEFIKRLKNERQGLIENKYCPNDYFWKDCEDRLPREKSSGKTPEVVINSFNAYKEKMQSQEKLQSKEVYSGVKDICTDKELCNLIVKVFSEYGIINKGVTRFVTNVFIINPQKKLYGESSIKTRYENNVGVQEMTSPEALAVIEKYEKTFDYSITDLNDIRSYYRSPKFYYAVKNSSGARIENYGYAVGVLSKLCERDPAEYGSTPEEFEKVKKQIYNQGEYRKTGLQEKDLNSVTIWSILARNNL